MTDLTLDQLTGRVEKDRQRRRERYAFARSLGFSSRESNILSRHTEVTIEKLAQERAEYLNLMSKTP